MTAKGAKGVILGGIKSLARKRVKLDSSSGSSHPAAPAEPSTPPKCRFHFDFSPKKSKPDHRPRMTPLLSPFHPSRRQLPLVNGCPVAARPWSPIESLRWLLKRRKVEKRSVRMGWGTKQDLERAPPSDLSTCPACHRVLSSGIGAAATLFVCSDCPLARPQCSHCIVSTHQARPFDHIRMWCTKRRFWRKANLAELGVVLYLGHDGECCPTTPKHLDGSPDLDARVRQMVVVHKHGIMKIATLFCQCPRRQKSEPFQLLEVGLWPATWKHPRTAITLTTLETYHSLSARVTVNINDYVEHLRHLTDAVITEEVPDRYREFNNAMREYAFIRRCRRAGQKPRRNMPARSLAAVCPACPQPGLNMRDGWKQRAEEFKYLDALHFAIDGNYHFNQKAPRSDPNDFPLTRERSTCSNFGAMEYGKYKGNITGIVAFLCRHMLVLPGGIINLHGGEKFFYVDFAMISAMQPYLDLDLLIAMYDIICQYIINLAKRLNTEFTNEMLEELESIISAKLPQIHAGVGKYHLAMHTKECQKKFSLHLLPGACMDDGEWDEQHWGIISPLSRRLKEMAVGHREDTLNDLTDDQNVQRVHKMTKSLGTKLEKGEKHLEGVTEYLDSVEDSITSKHQNGEDLLDEWRVHEAEWTKKMVDIKRHKEIESDYPYEPPAEAALTSGQIHATLTDEQVRKGDRSGFGLVNVIHEMLRLDEDQQGLEERVRLFSGSEKERSVLANDVRDFCGGRAKSCETVYQVHMQPCVDTAIQAFENVHVSAQFPRRDPLEDYPVDGPSSTTSSSIAASENVTPQPIDPSTPTRKRKREGLTDEIRADLLLQLEQAKLPLPSDYHVKIREHPAMCKAVEYERLLQQGYATEALDSLRMHLTTHATLRENTKWDRRIAAKRDAINHAKERYRKLRRILLLLGMPENDTTFKPLTENDCRAFTVLDVECKLGDSRKLLSWIWGDFSFVDKTTVANVDKFLIGSLRAHWFQVTTVREEMYRTVTSYKHDLKMWRQRALDREKEGDLAAAAYARRQAYRWKRLTELAEAKFPSQIYEVGG
ncbi:hypothetical protein LXA43DRAFT_975014 [Ganoderma leucocontextum]|nr:hypothetical protein LXA43DRAFT_975014 [Ganoderma leucocontextum]